MTPAEYEQFVVDIWVDGSDIGVNRLDLRGLFICCTGLAGEAGEALEVLHDNEALADELGDVLYYLVRIAAHYGIRFESILCQRYELSDCPAMDLPKAIGRVLEHIKKAVRKDVGVHRPTVRRLMGDVMKAMLQLAEDRGFWLEAMIAANHAKLSERYDVKASA